MCHRKGPRIPLDILLHGGTYPLGSGSRMVGLPGWPLLDTGKMAPVGHTLHVSALLLKDRHADDYALWQRGEPPGERRPRARVRVSVIPGEASVLQHTHTRLSSNSSFSSPSPLPTKCVSIFEGTTVSVGGSDGRRLWSLGPQILLHALPWLDVSARHWVCL